MTISTITFDVALLLAFGVNVIDVVATCLPPRSHFRLAVRFYADCWQRLPVLLGNNHRMLSDKDSK